MPRGFLIIVVGLAVVVFFGVIYVNFNKDPECVGAASFDHEKCNLEDLGLE